MARKSANIRRVIGRLFRERQIYHRSDGVVHFISMSSRTQIALAAVLLAALSWVAYASVNVIFKEQIIVAKEQDYRVLQTTLNARLFDKDRAYDEILALNDLQQENFEDAMRELNGRHQALEAVIAQKSRIDESLRALAEGLSLSGAPGGRRLGAANRLMIDPVGKEPTPRISRDTPLRREANAIGGRDVMRFASLREMHSQAALLRVQQMDLLTRIEEESGRRIEHIRGVLDFTGVPADVLVKRTKIDAPRLAQGGPFVALADAEQLAADDRLEDDGVEEFFKQSYRVATVLDRLNQYEEVMNSVPLGSPLNVRHRLSDDFGPRTDPINGRRAFHEGLDFAAPWGSPVNAPAAGRVVYAAVRSTYGKTVEIDHGNGFRTRFAHLSKISVRRGDTVTVNQKVGALGSTGRSTGPHLHYEVYYKGVPRDPHEFVKAGRYVFES
ncbi:MAG: M23 family metallopeptidase [Pseudomonadota bacterium]